MYFRQALHRSKALETIEDAISEMKAYQSLMNDERQRLVQSSLQVPLEILDIQFTERPGNMMIPYCISTDELTSPLILIAHFMTARAEMELVCNPLDCAAVIQSGEVFSQTNAKNVNSLSLLFEKLTKKLDDINASFTHQHVFEDDSYAAGGSGSGGGGGGGRRGSQFLLPVNTAATPVTPGIPDSKSGDDAHGTHVDPLAIAMRSANQSPLTDVLTSSRPGTSGPNPRRPPSTGSPSSALHSGRQSGIDFNIWKAEDGGTGGGEGDDEKENSSDEEHEEEALSDIPRSNFDLEAATDMVDSYRALIDFAKGPIQAYAGAASNAVYALKNRYGILEDKSGKLSGPKKTFVRHPNQYVSPVHDGVSVRAELIPMMPIVGRDDVSCWVQWAIAQSQSFGFGFMGMGSLSTTVDSVPTFASDSLSKPQLEYVREKLANVERKMSKKFDDERKFRAGDRERMLLLNAVLAKISAQLAMRKEAGIHVKKMEDLQQSIVLNSDKAVSGSAATSNNNNNKISMRTTVFDSNFSALVKRFRLDFEEWDISEDMISGARKKIGRWMLMLKVAKEYVTEAESSGDVLLRRDAIKKICNCYMEIVQAPLTDKPKGGGNPHRKVTSAGGGDDDDVDDEEPVNESTLLKLGEEIIEEYETEDPAWIKRFGKLRAQHFASRLKYISPQ